MKTEELCYCKRCGRIVVEDVNSEKKCDFCNYIIQPIPAEYLYEKCDTIILSEQRKELMKNCICPSPEFDPELHKKLEHWLDTRWDKPSKKPGNPYGIECPYCHSTYFERIGGITRTLFTDASAVGKQFKCSNCKAYF